MSAKLAIFVPNLGGGGAEKVMVMIAGKIAERGHRVDLLVVRGEGPYIKQISPKVRLVDLHARRTILSLPSLVKYLRNERPVTILSTLDHANLVTLLAKLISCVRTRVVIREATIPSISADNAHSIKEKIMPWLISLFYPLADIVVAVSHAVANDLIRISGLPKNKIKVIYNPVDVEGILRKVEEGMVHPWFRPKELPVVLGVGRLNPPKSFVDLIRAFAIVRAQKQCRLVILGEGPERPALVRLARELGVHTDVWIPGFVENPYPYMKHASVFVLPSKFEGMPNVLIEALALGVPVVATNCLGGSEEVLEHGKWGKLTPPGDSVALAMAIISTLSKPILPTREAVDCFLIEKIITQYEDVLLLSRSNK